MPEKPGPPAEPDSFPEVPNPDPPKQASTKIQVRRRLSDSDRIALCQCIAEYGDLRMVCGAMEKKYGIVISPHHIKNIARVKPWRDIVVEFRKQYMEGIQEIAIANHRWRIEEMERLYNFVKSQDGLTFAEQQRVNTLLKILDQVQSELDPGKKGKLIEQFNQQIAVVFQTGDGGRLGVDGLRSPPGPGPVPPEQG